MNAEDVIRMAREAGIKNDCDSIWCNADQLQRFADLVADAEREACAKVVDHMASRCNDIRAAALESAAENIRAKGNT